MREYIKRNSIIKVKCECNNFEITIGQVIGYGATCIVYQGMLKMELNDKIIDRQVIVKEFYPNSINIERSDNNELLVCDEDINRFSEMEKLFLEGQGKHSQYYELSKESCLPRAFIYGKANNTSYAISDPGVGSPLTTINRDELTLSRVSLLMESLCKAFGKMHHAGLLYLDCKPDNIFFSQQNIEDKVYLCDFDTNISLEDIETNCYESCSYSIGWAAPEQLPLFEGGGYSNPKRIGYHTDIFSIGTVFFWLLTGKKLNYTATEYDELEKIQRNQFEWRKESSLCNGVSDNVIDSINSIAKMLLNPDPVERKKKVGTNISTNKVATLFGELYGITIGDNNHFGTIHSEVSEIKSNLEVLLKNTVIEEESNRREIRKNLGHDVRIATYQELLNCGWNSMSIAERLVENDLNLYDTSIENEGTPELWEQYISSYPETFRYLINSKNEIIGNWSFLSVSKETISRIDKGDLFENELAIDATEFALFPGNYYGYLLNFSINEMYNTSENYVILIESLSEHIKYLAKQNIFFYSLHANVFRKDHIAMYRKMGFVFRNKNKKQGDIYKLDFVNHQGRNTLLFTKEIEQIYEEHFK